MSDWIASVIASSLATTALLSIAGWLLKGWITTRLTEGVRRETEEKLVEARLRADTKLAQLQDRLAAAESQAVDARRAGIEALHQSNAAVLAQRVTATQEIWKAVVRWRQATALSFILSAFTEKIAVANALDSGGRDTMQTMLKSLESANLMTVTTDAEKWRPFVSERAWALWIVYNAFFASRLTKATMIKLGQKPMVERLWQVNTERELVRSSTTDEIVAEFERSEITGSPKAIGYWETELLAELRRGLAGEESGPETARQAAKVIATAQELMTKSAVDQAGAAGSA